MVEAGKHGAGACLYFRASVLWYVVFFSMAVDDRGLNQIWFAMISACGPAQTYNATFGFELRAIFEYCILNDVMHTIRTGARRPIE